MEIIEKLEELIKQIWPDYPYSGWPVLAAILSFIATISKVIYEEIKAHKARKILKRFTKAEVKKHYKYYINPLGISPHINNKKPFNIIKHFKGKIFPSHDTNKHYIIFGDSGTGKTSLLINLVLKSISLLKFWRKYNLVLIPIRSISTENDIIKIIDKKESEQTILLLDGLDEDKGARENLDSRLQQLYEWTRDFRKIIITCRNQFFSSDKEFPNKTTESYFTDGGKFFKVQHVFIEPFNRKQVKAFLRKKYRWWKFWQPLNIFKRVASKRLVLDFQDIHSRPLLLSYINDLLPSSKSVFKITLYLWNLKFVKLVFSSKSEIRGHFVTQLEKKVDWLYSRSAYTTKTMVYRTIIKRWIERESERIRDDKEYEKHQNVLFRLALLAAELIYIESRDNNKLSVSKGKLFEKARKHGIELNDIDISSRSLLFRNSEGEFIFAHKSILEYFLAISATNDVNLNNELHNQNGWDNFIYFFQEIMTIGKIVPFIQSAGSRISLQYHKYGSFEPVTSTITIDEINKAVSLKITDDIGHVDSNLFVMLGNLTIDAYMNIAEYLVYKQHYCFEEITDLLNTFNRNNDDQYTVLKRTIDIYEYFRLFEVAAICMEKYIELRNMPFHSPEQEKLIEFYGEAKNKEKYLPLRKRLFKDPIAGRFGHYLYISDLYNFGYYAEAIEEYLQFEGEFEYASEIYSFIIQSYLNLDNYEAAITLYNEKYTKLGKVWSVLGVFADWFNKRAELDRCLVFIKDELSKLSGEAEILSSFLYGKELYKKDKDQSIQFIQQLQSKYNSNLSFIMGSPEFYRDIDDDNSALEAALIHVNVFPKEFRPYNQVANCYSRLGNSELAIKYYKLSIEKFDSGKLNGHLHGIVFHNLAENYNSQSQFEEAIEYYKKAVETVGESRIEDYTWDLAECYENAGRYEDAFYTFRSLWARFHSRYYLAKAIETSIKTDDVRHVVRMYELLKKNEEWSTTEKVNSSKQKMIEYLVDKNIFEERNGEFKFPAELYHNYYENLSKLFLAQ